VERHAAEFGQLRVPLQLAFDDVVRTSSDPRHRPAVERLWRACAAAGDLYLGRYEGRYCIGCEQFYDADELVAGCCPEHDIEPEPVVEANWFFRLSRYAGRIAALIRSDDLPPRPTGEHLHG
jgi:methionyl-tRNA synthetase